MELHNVLMIHLGVDLQFGLKLSGVLVEMASIQSSNWEEGGPSVAFSTPFGS